MAHADPAGVAVAVAAVTVCGDGVRWMQHVAGWQPLPSSWMRRTGSVCSLLQAVHAVHYMRAVVPSASLPLDGRQALEIQVI